MTFGESMKFSEQKELTPVEYDSSGVKILDPVTIAPHGLCFPLHWHERMELLLIHENSIKLLLGEETVVLHAGELAIINPGQLHGGFAETDGVCYSTIMFEPSALLNGTRASSLLIQPIIDHRVRFLHRCDDPGIVEIATSLTQTTKSPLFAQAKLYELIGLFYKNCLNPITPTVIFDDRFQSILTYIHQHFCKNFTSNGLSKQFGYDSSYFCRKFKALTGMTLTNYVRLLRLEKAQKLLCTKDTPIHQLAASCGFTDVSYFCRCFKKHFSVSPSEYQKQHKNTPIP